MFFEVLILYEVWLYSNIGKRSYIGKRDDMQAPKDGAEGRRGLHIAGARKGDGCV